MQYMNAHLNRIAMLALSFVLVDGPRALAQAPERARDFDPATALERKQQRAAAGPVAFHGAAGYFDYVTPITALPEVVLSALPPLFTFSADGLEPIDALRRYQTRGQRVDINWNQLDAMAPDKQHRLRVPLFDGEEIELVFTRCERRGPSRYTWFGQIAGIAASHFVLVRQDDAVDLVINNYNDRREYEMHIVPAFGEHAIGHALRKRGDILPSDAQTFGAASSDEHGGTAPEDSTLEPPFAGEPEQLVTVSDDTRMIHVLFVCTAQARVGYGTENAFWASAEQCLTQMNIRLSNSDTDLAVYLMSADWDLGGNYNENANGHLDWLNLVSSFVFEPTRTAAADRRADLIVLIRESGWGGSAGIYFSPPANAPMNSSDLNSQTSPSQYSVGARNGPIPLTTDVFPRLMGHCFGACNALEDGNDCNVQFPAPLAKRFNCFDTINCWDAWNTVMADRYWDECFGKSQALSEPVPFFSSPGLHYFSGICNPAMGDFNSNAALLIEINRAVLSQRRIASTQRWVNVLGPGINDPILGGRYQYPHSRITVGVTNVLGGVAEAKLRVRGHGPGQANTYNETAANGGQPVTLSNPCTIVKWGVPGELDIVIK